MNQCVKRRQEQSCAFNEILLGPWKNKGLHTLLPSAADGKPWDSSQSHSSPSCVWIQTIVSHWKRLRSQGYVSIRFHLLTEVLAQFKITITEVLKFHWASSIKKHPEDTSTVWWALYARRFGMTTRPPILGAYAHWKSKALTKGSTECPVLEPCSLTLLSAWNWFCSLVLSGHSQFKAHHSTDKTKNFSPHMLFYIYLQQN